MDDVGTEFTKRVEAQFGNTKAFGWWNDECLRPVSLAAKSVLDIGCSDGMRTLYLCLKHRPAAMVAVDSYAGEGSAVEGEKAFHDLVARLGLTTVKILKADVTSLSLPEGSFDAITCLQVAHHIFDRTTSVFTDPDLRRAGMEFFTKIHRLLKPGGCLILEEVSNQSLFRYLKVAKTDIEWRSKRPAAEWIHLLQNAGFSRSTVRYYVPFRVKALKALLGNRACSFFLGSKYFIHAYR
jgi:SAM-dependent methyltransferase